MYIYKKKNVTLNHPVVEKVANIWTAFINSNIIMIIIIIIIIIVSSSSSIFCYIFINIVLYYCYYYYADDDYSLNIFIELIVWLHSLYW